MSLYPTIDIDPSVQGRQTSPQGSLALIPITIDPGQAVRVVLLQTGPAQDFSMRAWVSVLPDGVSVSTDSVSAYWSLPRMPDMFILHDVAVTPDATAFRTIPVPPGSYVLNILNLVNSENTFSFSTAVVN